MSRFRRCLFGISVVLLNGAPASADPKFSIDPSVNLKELSDSGRIAITTSHTGSVYQVDTSAVLAVEAGRFLDVTVNFENYVSMDMDHVSAAHCIGGSCQARPLIFWMSLGALGVHSKSYGVLQTYRSLDPAIGSMGASWHGISGKKEWGYDDSPLFKDMEGSLYVMPMGEARGDGTHLTYIRYVAGATVQTILPDFLIEGFAKHEMGVNIRSFVQKLAKASVR